MRSRNASESFIPDKFAFFAFWALDAFQEERGDHFLCMTAGASFDCNPGIDLRFHSTFQTEMRTVVRNALCKLSVVWMVGIDLPSRLVEIEWVAIGPCLNGFSTFRANESPAFSHAEVSVFFAGNSCKIHISRKRQ